MISRTKFEDNYNKKLISKFFVRYSSGDKRRNEGKKNSINFVIKLHKDDWLHERSVTTRDQRKSFKLLTNSF